MRLRKIFTTALSIALVAVAATSGIAGTPQDLPQNCGRECTTIAATFLNAASYAAKAQYRHSVAQCDQKLDVSQVQALKDCYQSAATRGLITMAGLSAGGIGGYVTERMLSERARMAEASSKRYHVGYDVHGIIPPQQYGLMHT